jgi:hypothetical protein
MKRDTIGKREAALRIEAKTSARNFLRGSDFSQLFQDLLTNK